MADEFIKISDLDDAGPMTGAELVPVVQDGVTVKTPASNIPASDSNAVKLSGNQSIAGEKNFEAILNAELGISFGAGGANKTLDDYEEGTWTPTLSFTGTTGTIGYSQRVGTYTRIGDMVYVQMLITLNEYLGANSGFNRIQGLPFTPSSNTDFVFGAMFTGISNFDGHIAVRVDATNQLRVCKVGANSVSIPENNAFSNVSAIRCAIAYKIA